MSHWVRLLSDDPRPLHMGAGNVSRLAITDLVTLGERLHNRQGECAEVVQLLGDNGLDDVQIQAVVFVHGNVAEANYPLYSGSRISHRPLGSLQFSLRYPVVPRSAWHSPNRHTFRTPVWPVHPVHSGKFLLRALASE